jgi:hypothetical protein
VGRSEAEVGNTTWTSPLLDLSWVRNLGTRSRLGVTAGKGFSDAATAFVNGNAAGGAGTNFVIAVRDPYEFVRVGLNWALTYERTVVNVNVGTGEARYTETVGFDNDERSFGIAVQRELRARLRLGASTGYWERDFVAAMREDTDRYRDLFLDKTIGRRWSMRVTAERSLRDRGQGAGGYEEDAVRVAFTADLNP